MTRIIVITITTTTIIIVVVVIIIIRNGKNNFMHFAVKLKIISLKTNLYHCTLHNNNNNNNMTRQVILPSPQKYSNTSQRVKRL